MHSIGTQTPHKHTQKIYKIVHMKRQRIKKNPVADRLGRNRSRIFTHYFEENAPAILDRKTILNEHERLALDTCNTQMSKWNQTHRTKIEEYTHHAPNRTEQQQKPIKSVSARMERTRERERDKKTPVARLLHSHENNAVADDDDDEKEWKIYRYTEFSFFPT